jgi:heat shock protein HslJ
MAPKYKLLSLYGLLLTALLSGCALPTRVDKPNMPALSPAALAGTEWVAFAIDGVPEVTTPKPRLHWVSADQVTGTGGCNSFRGSALLGGGTLRLGPLASTGRACLSMPGSQEDLYFKALELTHKARLERDQLLLLDDAGNVLARFLKAN